MMNPDQVKRLRIKQDLEVECVSTIEQRTDRYLEVGHQWIIGNHHFAEASSECVKLYRDGYFISAVMVSQAINEGIIKFIAERNGIDPHTRDSEGKSRAKKTCDLINEFKEKDVISTNCAQASERIYNSFRNDVHHMNPKVAEIDFKEFAKRNLQDLSTIEKEIFDVKVSANGGFIPQQPKYWNFSNDGKMAAYLRISP